VSQCGDDETDLCFPGDGLKGVKLQRKVFVDAQHHFPVVVWVSEKLVREMSAFQAIDRRP
jgi:hypothetical protein